MSDRSKRVELLAPGGSLEGIRGAVHAGADAVYAGGRLFGARAYAQNPDTENLLEAIDYCHLHGVKLYLTVNTLLKENELTDLLPEYLAPIYEHGVDAVLVQDFGVFRFLRHRFPDLKLHASTQMTVTGPDGALLLRQMGAERVVLSRELSLKEIAAIRSQCEIELETFVHGALCYCYSGKCLMSSLIGGRSGNRGRCAQPCRLPYDLFGSVSDAKKRGSLNRPEEQYLLSPKDICTLRLLPDLIDAGIASLKIEGRMKSAEYAAGVTAMYRKYIDQYLEKGREGFRVDPADEALLLNLFSRGEFSEGYYHTRNGASMIVRREKESAKTDVRGSSRGDALRNAQETVARIRKQYVEERRLIPLTARVSIRSGRPASMCVSDRNGRSFRSSGFIPSPALNRPADRDQVLRQIGKTGNTEFSFSSIDIDLEDGLFVPVRELNELRRSALDGIRDAILDPYRRPARVPGEDSGRHSSEGSDRHSPEGSGSQSSGGSGRQVPEASDSGKPDVYRKEISSEDREIPSEGRENAAWAHPAVTASVCTQQQLAAVLKNEQAGGVYLDYSICTARNADLVRGRGKRVYLMLPAIWRADTAQTVKRMIEREFGPSGREIRAALDGILVRSYDQLYTLRSAGLQGDGFEVIADADLYTWNSQARVMLAELGVTMDTLPYECSAGELEARGMAGSECVIYGYQTLMTSVQCLVKTTTGCRHEKGIRCLRDRKGFLFPVKNDCSICTNTIFNSVPLELTAMSDRIRRSGAASVRYLFTIESGEETHRILNGILPEQITRGHYRKGVE